MDLATGKLFAATGKSVKATFRVPVWKNFFKRTLASGTQGG
jgi:hypothetical protein